MVQYFTFWAKFIFSPPLHCFWGLQIFSTYLSNNLKHFFLSFNFFSNRTVRPPNPIYKSTRCLPIYFTLVNQYNNKKKNCDLKIVAYLSSNSIIGSRNLIIMFTSVVLYRLCSNNYCTLCPGDLNYCVFYYARTKQISIIDFRIGLRSFIYTWLCGTIRSTTRSKHYTSTVYHSSRTWRFFSRLQWRAEAIFQKQYCSSLKMGRLVGDYQIKQWAKIVYIIFFANKFSFVCLFISYLL